MNGLCFRIRLSCANLVMIKDSKFVLINAWKESRFPLLAERVEFPLKPQGRLELPIADLRGRSISHYATAATLSYWGR